MKKPKFGLFMLVIAAFSFNSFAGEAKWVQDCICDASCSSCPHSVFDDCGTYESVIFTAGYTGTYTIQVKLVGTCNCYHCKTCAVLYEQIAGIPGPVFDYRTACSTKCNPSFSCTTTDYCTYSLTAGHVYKLSVDLMSCEWDQGECCTSCRGYACISINASCTVPDCID